MLHRLAAVLLLFLLSASAMAETPVPQLMGDRLRAGEAARLAQELEVRVAAAPGDDQARFALAAARFIRTVELFAQDMHRHGLQPPRAAQMMLPFFRFPLPPNPAAEPLDYEGMREVFKRALSGFAGVEETLAAMGQGEVKLPVAVGLARLDLDGNGTSEEQESLFSLFNATLGGGNLPPETAERFIITFDRGDAAWLRGYANLLSALLEFLLAHDGRASFEASAHMLFPHANLPECHSRPTAGHLPRIPRHGASGGPHRRHPPHALAGDGTRADGVGPRASRAGGGAEPGELAFHPRRNR